MKISNTILYSIIIIIAVSIVGLFLSLNLLTQHHLPEVAMSSVLCGTGLENNCIALARSGYATIFNLPIALFGIIAYSVFIVLALVSIIARGKYLDYFIAFILPVSIFSIIADCILGFILIKLGTPCFKCIITYGINIAILAIAVFEYRYIRSEGNGLLTIIREAISGLKDASHRASFGAIALLLCLIVFTSMIHNSTLSLKVESRSIPEEKIRAAIKYYYTLPIEKMPRPEDGILVGEPDAEVTIVAFTDFLCSACYHFYKTEKFLFSRFRGKINVLYYNYPLDKTCNPFVSRTVYPNSCLAAKAFTSAAQRNYFLDYLISHFGNYEKNYHLYKKGNVARSINEFAESKNLSGAERTALLTLFKSDGVQAKLEKDIILGSKLKVNSVPTLFINGRRFDGVPPLQILEAIIEEEIKRY